MSNRRYRLMILLSALILPLLLAAGASATRIHYGPYLKVRATKKLVVVTACDFTGKKLKNCCIEVFDSRGTLLLEGKTDQYGKFSFQPPTLERMVIVLITEDGHRVEHVLKAKKKPQPTPEPEASPTPEPTPSGDTP